MWIQSQDKRVLVNTDNISAIKIIADDDKFLICADSGGGFGDDLGCYGTEREAMYVLKCIRGYIEHCDANTLPMPPDRALNHFEM